MTNLVAARMGSQLSCERDCGTEEEDAVERVQHDHEDRMNSPIGVIRRWDQVEER